MGTRPVRRGEVSQRVSDAIRAHREARKWSLTDLRNELAKVGHPLVTSAVSKIETGDRRVDVEDLVAFANVFDVTPDDLLNNRRSVAASAGGRADAQVRQAGIGLDGTDADSEASRRIQAVAAEIDAAVSRQLEPVREHLAELERLVAPGQKFLAEYRKVLRQHGYDGPDGRERLWRRFGLDTTLGEVMRQLKEEESAPQAGDSPSTDSTVAATEETRRRPKYLS